MDEFRASGVFETKNASKYMQQLCKHFAHKVAVEYDIGRGRAELPPGSAMMEASAERLTVTVTAKDADGLVQAQYIIDSHLARSAFRESFERMSWQID